MKQCINLLFLLSLLCGNNVSLSITATEEADRINVRLAELVLEYKKWQGTVQTSDIHTSFATPQEIEELEIDRLLQGSRSYPSPFETHTFVGKCGLRLLMEHPISNLSLLQARQEFIRTLVEDAPFRAKLDQLLAECNTYETALLAYAHPQDDLSRRAASLYFNQPDTFFGLFPLPRFTAPLNRSAVCLDGAMIKELSKKLFMLVSIFGVGGMLHNLADSLEEQRAYDPLAGYKQGLQEIIDNHNPFAYRFGSRSIDQAVLDIKNCTLSPAELSMTQFNRGMLLSRPLGARILDFQNISDRCKSPLFYPVAFLAAAGSQLLHDYFYYHATQNQLEGIKDTYTTMQELHTRTKLVSRYFKTIEKIEKLLATSHDPAVQQFANICLEPVPALSKKMKQLKKLLNDPTFNDGQAVFYRRGNALLAHNLIKETFHELPAFLRRVAVVDAHVALAHFMIKSTKKQLPICFVDYLKDNAPTECTIINGWLPSLTRELYVCNSVQLGGAQPWGLILTGPNGCGKSTILKMIGIVEWFAHTCGIAPAQEACISLLDSIRTSLHIDHKDNMAGGLSTYMVADAAGERMLSHALQSKKTLLLYSEPYRGTPDQETARKIMSFAHHLSTHDSLLLAIETHVYEPTTLAHTLPGKFANGHMTIKEHNGIFERTFKLESGPAHWWFADHAKRARFVDWVTILRKEEEVAQEAYINELIEQYKQLLAEAEKEKQEELRQRRTKGMFKALGERVKKLIHA